MLINKKNQTKSIKVQLFWLRVNKDHNCENSKSLTVYWLLLYYVYVTPWSCKNELFQRNGFKFLKINIRKFSKFLEMLWILWKYQLSFQKHIGSKMPFFFFFYWGDSSVGKNPCSENLKKSVQTHSTHVKAKCGGCACTPSAGSRDRDSWAWLASPRTCSGEVPVQIQT